MSVLKKQPIKTVLGVAVDGSRLDAVLLRRTNGSAEVQKSHQGALSLDLLHNEPELVGREIRNQLESAGIRERRCVVALPASWVLTHLIELPAEILGERWNILILRELIPIGFHTLSKLASAFL